MQCLYHSLNEYVDDVLPFCSLFLSHMQVRFLFVFHQNTEEMSTIASGYVIVCNSTLPKRQLSGAKCKQEVMLVDFCVHKCDLLRPNCGV